jgi:ABC-type transport system involved in multi-copper enzyme maturation permease subunit
MLRYETLLHWRQRSVLILILTMLVFGAFTVLIYRQTNELLSANVGEANARYAATVLFVAALWSQLHMLILVVVPLVAADAIVRDRQFGVDELLLTTPTTLTSYLLGKLLAMTALIFLIFGAIGTLIGAVWWFTVQPFDIPYYAGMWLLSAAPLAAVSAGIALFLASVMRSRRFALLAGFVIAAVCIVALTGAFRSHAYDLGDYLNPGRPLMLAYYMSVGDTFGRLGLAVPTQEQLLLTIGGGVAQVALAGFIAWGWLRRRAYA